MRRASDAEHPGVWQRAISLRWPPVAGEPGCVVLVDVSTTVQADAGVGFPSENDSACCGRAVRHPVQPPSCHEASIGRREIGGVPLRRETTCSSDIAEHSRRRCPPILSGWRRCRSFQKRTSASSVISLSASARRAGKSQSRSGTRLRGPSDHQRSYGRMKTVHGARRTPTSRFLPARIPGDRSSAQASSLKVGAVPSVEGPPFRSPDGWQCQVGEDRGSWAISCTGRGSVIRAYGPIAHTGTWAQAAAQARIRVEIPRTTLGLSLTNAVGAKRCGGSEGPSWVYATYGRADGASLTVAEGRPYTCGQLGGPTLVAVWNIRGHAAGLSEYCGPTGCARISGQWALDWVEQGIEITLITGRLSQHELLAIAQSLSSLPG